MAVDSRLEKFAIDTFYIVGKRKELSDTLLEKWNDNESRREDAFMEDVCNLIICRLDAFRNKFMELEKDVKLLESNDVNFVQYIRENMNKYFPYPRMNIYDKMFMSCAVVIKLSELLHREKKHISCAPQVWSMYFEREFKEEFYAKEECWENLEKYAKDSNTCAIQNWRYASQSQRKYDTDLEFAEHVLSFFEKSYCCNGIIETFKQRLSRPLGGSCCSKGLPLFDVLYFLTFKRKLVSDFQLVEGYVQLFLKMWHSDSLDFMFDQMLEQIGNYDVAYAEAQDNVSGLFKSRVFSNNEFNNSVEEQGGNNCMFCKDKIEKDVVYLKSIICRTVREVEIENQEEKMKDLRKFLFWDL